MVLKISNLSKQYKNGVHALDNINLSIPKGLFGFLGPNGAGKSSLMRTLATLQEPDHGDIRLGEIDVLKEKDRVRGILGYLPQEFGVYPRTSAIELLTHLAVLKGISDRKERNELVAYLLQKVNLFDHRKKAVQSYSGGMRQRFGIAQCLIGDPKLIIVDEPTAGLDPGERNRFYNLLSEISEEAILILSTHIVQDVEELCTQMAIMNMGEVIFQGSIDQALYLVKNHVFEKKIEKNELAHYRKNYQIISEKLVGGKPRIHIFSKEHPSNDFQETDSNLEDVYFSKINQLI